MVKSFLNWLKAWLLVTLFVFLVFSGAIVIFTLGIIFVTWSVPEFNDIESILFTVRALLAGSAFIGFCFTVSRD
ncbi:cell division protein FtsK [Escherichia coli]|uniref:cell division protein FtsK n=1 Tax=Escherichia coli TaxID=562 RepID=UPI000BE36C00|nr:cell division protein FtsK [Escherichia coli]